MIELPSRSITRFFIPMIDVLTLLFCIYLLMPLAVSDETAESEAERAARDQRIKELEEKARQQRGGELTEEMRAELEALRRKRVQVLQERMSFRLLEVDPKDGHLFYRNPNEVPIDNEKGAQRLVTQDRARIGAEQDLCYVILAPRDPNSGYPTRVDVEEKYPKWFKGVVLTVDYAGRGLTGVKP